MYKLLLYSFVVSSIIFSILQYSDKNNKEQAGETYEFSKHLFTMNNIVVYFMLFMTCMVILYFVLNDSSDLLSSFGLLGLFESDVGGSGTNKKIEIKESIYDVKKNTSIDPTMLKRMNDPLKYGFEPSSGGSDMSSNEASESESDDSTSSDSSLSNDDSD
jgi:hypothetical protein